MNCLCEMNRYMTLQDIAEFVNGRCIGDVTGVRISGIATLEHATSEQLSFYTGSKYKTQLQNTRAGAVIVAEIPDVEASVPYIVVRNVHLALAYLLPRFFKPVQNIPGIHPSAVIHKTAQIDDSCSIGPHVVIEKNVCIGKNVALFPGVFVGHDSNIGNDTVLHAHVTIGHQVSIGERVLIHAGTVIGSDGFGFARDKDRYIKILQLGSVTIQDDVEIGANCTIDRGSIGSTIIEQGVKIDNLVHVAHNVVIGENTVIAGQTGIAGSSHIGKRVVFGGQVGVNSHVTVGNDVIVTSRGTIMKNVPSGQMISGFPPIPHREWIRNQVALRHASKWASTLQSITKKLEKMEAEVASLKRYGKEIPGDSQDSSH